MEGPKSKSWWAQKPRTQPRHGQITSRRPRVLSPTNMTAFCLPPFAACPLVPTGFGRLHGTNVNSASHHTGSATAAWVAPHSFQEQAPAALWFATRDPMGGRAEQ